MKLLLVAALMIGAPLAAQDGSVHVRSAPIEGFGPRIERPAGEDGPAPSAVRSHALAGAAIGFGAGAGATWLLLNTGGSTALCDQERNQDAASDGECLALYGLGGLAGAGLGAAIGHFVRSERRPDPLGGVRLGAAPSRGGGMRVGVAVRVK